MALSLSICWSLSCKSSARWDWNFSAFWSCLRSVFKLPVRGIYQGSSEIVDFPGMMRPTSNQDADQENGYISAQSDVFEHLPPPSLDLGKLAINLCVVGQKRAEGKGVEPSTGCPAPDFELFYRLFWRIVGRFRG